MRRGSRSSPVITSSYLQPNASIAAEAAAPIAYARNSCTETSFHSAGDRLELRALMDSYSDLETTHFIGPPSSSLLYSGLFLIQKIKSGNDTICFFTASSASTM